MSIRTLVGFLSLFAVVMGAPSLQAQEMRGGTADDYTAIQTQHQSLLDDYNVGDASGFVEAYTEDAWHVSMRRPIAKNRDGLRAFFGPNMSKYEFHADYELLDLEVIGDVAFMIGRTMLHGVPRVDDVRIPPFTEDRIYTAVFKKADGKWLIHRYMESTSPKEGEAFQTPTEFCEQLAKDTGTE
jgi:ketosteroid isomerase-like protein